jgi:hypothetical protein
VLPPKPRLAYPVCKGGKHHGPPGDCGGIPGHYYLLDAISDPDHDQHKELQKRIGNDFDSEAFS